MYYLFVNKYDYKYYCNKSNNPDKSIERHFEIANDSTRKGYRTTFHKALREEGKQSFNIYKLNQLPDWVERLGRYVE